MKYRILQTINILIIIFAGLFFVLLVVTGCNMFSRGFVADRNDFSKASAKVSVVDTIYIYSGDSLVVENSLNLLQDRIKALEDREQTLLNDIRQESNNIIDKFNAWLGFWIAILALLCGVVPMVIQYILNNKVRLNTKRILEDATTKASIHQLQLLVSSYGIDTESSVIETTERDDFSNLILRDSYEQLDQIIKKIEENEKTLTRANEMHLVNALFHYYRLLEYLIVCSGSDRRNIRELQCIQDSIKKIIEDIFNHKQYSRESIWQRILDLMPKLCSLKYSH